jgi:hypothetical protein
MTTRTRGRENPASARALKSGCVFGAMILAAAVSAPAVSKADEGGVSFWVPGFFGSLAAAPQQAGWSLTTFYYHTSVSAADDVDLARERTLNRNPVNLTLSANLNANVSSKADLQFAALSYVLPTPILGGQAAFYLMGAYGRVDTSLAAQLSGTLSATTSPRTRPDAWTRLWSAAY